MALDVQAVTLIEAALLLAVNAAGALLTALAWRVSEVDVREARCWTPPPGEAGDRARRRHNRVLVAEDERFSEALRLVSHLLVATVGIFWLWTPQPVNPAVTWWAAGIRLVMIALSLVLIVKTAHHMAARWRFDRPEEPAFRASHVWPALRLAWRDVQALGTEARQ